MKLITIIVLNCNSGKSLKETIDSILECTKYPNYNITIVDNGSIDNSYSFLFSNKKYDDIQIIYLLKNYGCPKGLNMSLPFIGSDYIVFLNDDIVFTYPYWLEILVNEMERDKKLGAIGFKLFKMNDKPECCTNYLSKFTAYAGGLDINIFNTHIVPYVGLGSIMTRTDLIQKMGFEGKYFLYYDDLDYCIRLWFMGYKVKLSTNAWAYHKHQISVKRNITQLKARYYAERNSLLTFFIYTNNRERIKYLPFVLSFRLFSIVAELLLRQKEKAFSKILALLSIPYHYNWIKHKRKKIQKFKLTDMTYTDISNLSVQDLTKTRKIYKILKRLLL